MKATTNERHPARPEETQARVMLETTDQHYQGSTRGIPQNASRYHMNFWHTDAWSVETNPHSLEKPRDRYSLEVDWMLYEPMTK